MKYYPILMCLFVVSLFSSCEKEIKYNGKHAKSLLVVNSVIAADAPIEVFLSKSLFFMDSHNDYSVENGHVQLIVNLQDTLELMSDDGHIYTSERTVTAGDHCEIIAWADGFDKVWGQTTIPSKATIELVRTVDLGSKKRVYFKLTDPEVEDMCYQMSGNVIRARIGEPDEPIQYMTEELDFATDPIFSNRESSFDKDEPVTLINDDLFPSTSIEFYIEYTPLEDETSYGYLMTTQCITFTMESMTRELYYYHVSKNMNDENYDIFSEPVQIYTNVEGGIGIIGSQNFRTIILMGEIPQNDFDE